MNKKIIPSLILGVFALFNFTNVMANNESDNEGSNDPIAAISHAHENTIVNPANQDTTPNNNLVSTSSKESNFNKQSQDAIGNMLLQSVSLMGIAYKWGGNTPDTGMDCSGFVRYVFNKSLGINLPRTAAEMAKVGKMVDINNLQPGDLIFFNTSRGSNTHIGIYLGGNKFIQSPRTGETIQITDLSGYWVKHFNGAKRVVQEDFDSNGNATVQSYQDIRDEALPVAARRHHSSSRYHVNKKQRGHKTSSTSSTKSKVITARKVNHKNKISKHKKSKSY